MKKRLLGFAALAVFAVAAVGMTSCTTEKYYETIGENGSASMAIHEIDVHPSDWIWNPDFARYEAIKTVKEIDPRMVNKGAITGGVFVQEGNVETVKSLPFVKALQDDVTQIISFDYAVGEVAFYIQTSDPLVVQPELYGRTFKLSLFWDEYEQ